MKRWTLALLAWLVAAPASAVTVGFVTPATDPIVNDLFSVEIVAAGLGNAVIGAYDLDIGFDSSVITFVDAVPSGALGDPTGMMPTSIFSASAAGNVLDIFEVSLLTNQADLEALQPNDPVVLATLTFQAIASGTSPLSFDQLFVADFFGLPLDATGVDGSVSAIPEPSAALVFGSALLIAAACRRAARPRTL